MHLVEMRLKNWKCFKDEHVLKLEPKAYAVAARMHDDSERSNWLGKSSFLQAIAFALYGRHHEETEDAWITRGEKAGEVVLEFDNGLRVTRSRHHGKATKLYARGAVTGDLSGKPVDMMGDEAQSFILEQVGLSEQDFTATCYFEQEKMAQLVKMRSSDRMDIISEWLRLGPLEKCEALVRERAGKLLDQEHKLRVQVEASMDVRKQALGDCADLDALKEQHEKAKERRIAAKEKSAEVHERVKLSMRVKTARQDSERFDKMLEDGKEMAAAIAKKDELGLRRELEEAREALRDVDEKRGGLERDVEMKKLVAAGKFDGTCPVASIACPAKKEINAQLSENREALATAEKRSREMLVKRDAARKRVNEAEAAWQELGRMREHLAFMKREMERLVPQRKEWRANKDEELTDEEIGKLTDRVETALLMAAEEERLLAQRVSEVQRVEEKMQEAQREVQAIARELNVVREAMVIFGKQGAQRRIAESALGIIEAGANELLHACGIPLTLAVRWSREGSGLAKACDTCGHPFPSSAREKTCKHCGAPRGAHIVNKLDLVLSNRSGAADGLVGGALQIAASAWLRTERVSDWSIAIIDEPFGALDTYNRRAFSAHLQGMFSTRYGFNQSFVIAHHAAVLDALPGRIAIVSDGKHSTIQVAA